MQKLDFVEEPFTLHQVLGMEGSHRKCALEPDSRLNVFTPKAVP